MWVAEGRLVCASIYFSEMPTASLQIWGVFKRGVFHRHEVSKNGVLTSVISGVIVEDPW